MATPSISSLPPGYGGRDDAGDVEKGVEAAVGVVSDEGEVVVAATAVPVARHHDLAVGLEGDGLGSVLAGADVGGNDAVEV